MLLPTLEVTELRRTCLERLLNTSDRLLFGYSGPLVLLFCYAPLLPLVLIPLPLPDFSSVMAMSFNNIKLVASNAANRSSVALKRVPFFRVLVTFFAFSSFIVSTIVKLDLFCADCPLHSYCNLPNLAAFALLTTHTQASGVCRPASQHILWALAGEFARRPHSQHGILWQCVYKVDNSPLLIAINSQSRYVPRRR